MYWQVYLHKTVLCVEHMMIKAIERAKEMVQKGMNLPASDSLAYFMKEDPEQMDFNLEGRALDSFGLMDDHDVIAALKAWMKSDDPVLAYLCEAIVNRRLFKVEMQAEPFATEKKERIARAIQQELQVAPEDLHYFMIEDVTRNHAYDQAKGRIAILHKNGDLKDFSEVSDHGDLTSIIQPVSKHYLCYPKGLSI
jgi:hypothetical protein